MTGEWLTENALCEGQDQSTTPLLLTLTSLRLVVM